MWACSVFSDHLCRTVERTHRVTASRTPNLSARTQHFLVFKWQELGILHAEIPFALTNLVKILNYIESWGLKKVWNKCAICINGYNWNTFHLVLLTWGSNDPSKNFFPLKVENNTVITLFYVNSAYGMSFPISNDLSINFKLITQKLSQKTVMDPIRYDWKPSRTKWVVIFPL